jgi:hypothetical protein
MAQKVNMLVLSYVIFCIIYEFYILVLFCVKKVIHSFVKKLTIIALTARFVIYKIAVALE